MEALGLHLTIDLLQRDHRGFKMSYFPIRLTRRNKSNRFSPAGSYRRGLKKAGPNHKMNPSNMSFLLVSKARCPVNTRKAGKSVNASPAALMLRIRRFFMRAFFERLNWTPDK